MVVEEHVELLGPGLQRAHPEKPRHQLPGRVEIRVPLLGSLVIGLKLQGSLDLRYCPLRLTEVLQRKTDVKVRFRRPGIDVRCSPELGQCAFLFAQSPESYAETDVCFSMPRVDLQGPFKLDGSRFPVLFLEQLFPGVVMAGILGRFSRSCSSQQKSLENNDDENAHFF